ncbi:MAG: DegT/DnrJ/EryC1/StrS family aminotransferase [Spirochaetales bacterium]|jgi:dTDP-4-amino-4,6-dideoxygalactose transaminase|nr:DegT/DnrJ/EryC1/StrS family aminotransferase [Spirochaetales bacterium]
MNRNTDFIPFFRPSLGNEEEQALLAVLRSGWLTTGSEAKNFETEFASCIGTKHALALNSATAGLHLSLEALGIGPGDKVITTPYTFTSTAEVVRYLGADPVFVDIDPDALNMAPTSLENALEEDRKGGKVKAVIPVHIAGKLCDMEKILEICGEIPVIEDSAHAFPVKRGNTYGGAFGKAGIFSFYATKTITSGEGGMLVTNDDHLAKRASLMRLHGINREIWDRYTKQGASWEYDVVAPGFKYNMPDMAAAIGRVQLRRAEVFLKRRREIADLYRKLIGDQELLILPKKAGEDHAWHLFIIQVRGIDRNEMIRRLGEEGIGTSVHFKPLHIMTYYRKRYGYLPEDFPVSLAAYKHAISLPIYPGLTDSEVERIAETLIKTAGYLKGKS